MLIDGVTLTGGVLVLLEAVPEMGIFAMLSFTLDVTAADIKVFPIFTSELTGVVLATPCSLETVILCGDFTGSELETDSLDAPPKSEKIIKF